MCTVQHMHPARVHAMSMPKLNCDVWPCMHRYERWEPTAQEKAQFGLETVDGRVFFLLNSTELRLIDYGQTKFAMDEVPDAGFHPVRISPRVGRTQATADALRAQIIVKQVRLPSDTENNILARCWCG